MSRHNFVVISVFLGAESTYQQRPCVSGASTADGSMSESMPRSIVVSICCCNCTLPAAGAAVMVVTTMMLGRHASLISGQRLGIDQYHLDLCAAERDAM